MKNFWSNNQISNEVFEKYGVKRGLRNSDGTGVIAGLTNICNVHGYLIDDGERIRSRQTDLPHELTWQILFMVCAADNRFGFEEVIWLLIFGTQPTKKQLEDFTDIISSYRELPEYFAEDMIIKAPSANIMNKLARRFWHYILMMKTLTVPGFRECNASIYSVDCQTAFHYDVFLPGEKTSL